MASCPHLSGSVLLKRTDLDPVALKSWSTTYFGDTWDR